MARHFEIEERKNTIRVSAGQDLPLWARILACFIPAVAAISIGNVLLGRWTWFVAVCIAAIAFVTVRGSHAVLDVTKVEFVTRGNIGRRGTKAKKIVFTGDVRGLEFRESTGWQTGLYALTSRSPQCVLPFVDYSESMQVVGLIQKKFPGLAESWKIETGSSERVLTIGLGKEI